MEKEKSQGKGGGTVRRPMNAFLIFCKRHRSLVREKNPHLDNRSVTRILGELWANLPPGEKASYTSLANEYKEAFLKANPDYKWFNPDKGAGGREKPSTRPTNSLTSYTGQIPHTEQTDTSPVCSPNKTVPPGGGLGGVSMLLMAEQSLVNSMLAGGVPSSGYTPGMTLPHSQQQQTMHTVHTPVTSYQQQQYKIIPQGVTTIGNATTLGEQLTAAVLQSYGLGRPPMSTQIATSTTQALPTYTLQGPLPPSKPLLGPPQMSKPEPDSNVALLELAKMCSTELASKDRATYTELKASPTQHMTLPGHGTNNNSDSSNIGSPVPGSMVLTPPWTPNYPSEMTFTPKTDTDKKFDPPKNQEGKSLKEVRPPPKKRPYIQQEDILDYSTKIEQKNVKMDQGVKTVTPEALKMSQRITPITDTKLSKLVMEQVIDAMYSKDLMAKNEETAAKTTAKLVSGVTQRSADAASSQIGSGQRDRTISTSSVGSDHWSSALDTSGGKRSNTSNGGSENGSGKVSLTFGEIQEKLIRKAVENSYDLGIGLSRASKPVVPQPQAKPVKVADKENKQNSTAQSVTFDPPIQPSVESHPSRLSQAAHLKDSLKRKIDSQISEDKGEKKKKKTKIDKENKPLKTNDEQDCQVFPESSLDDLNGDVSGQRSEDTQSVSSTEDSIHENDPEGSKVRKSKRSNRGRRYQELIEQGILQPGREKTPKEAMPSPVTPSVVPPIIKKDVSKENSMDAVKEKVRDHKRTVSLCDTTGDDLRLQHVAPVNPGRKRNYSETDASPFKQAKRYNSGFDLDAQIASLPACHIDQISRKPSKVKGQGKIRHHSDSSALRCPSKDQGGLVNVAELRQFICQPNEPVKKTIQPAVGSKKRKARKIAITHLHLLPGPNGRPSTDNKALPSLINNNCQNADSHQQRALPAPLPVTCVSMATLTEMTANQRTRMDSANSKPATMVPCE